MCMPPISQCRVDVQNIPAHNPFNTNSSQKVAAMCFNPAYGTVLGDSEQPMLKGNPAYYIVDRLPACMHVYSLASYTHSLK